MRLSISIDVNSNAKTAEVAEELLLTKIILNSEHLTLIIMFLLLFMGVKIFSKDVVACHDTERGKKEVIWPQAE